jgi:exonuclease SbcD
LRDIVQHWLDETDKNMPVIFATHAMVQGAVYGGFESMVLGNEFVIEPSLVRDPRFDYVALGHIHKSQNLNEGAHPPVIYPGSIERVSFGEAKEIKKFVIAQVERGNTKFEWRSLKTRPFIDFRVRIDSATDVMEHIREELSPRSALRDAVVRLTIEYPREWEALIDENALNEFTSEAFDFRILRKPIMQTRLRLPDDKSIGSLKPLELLEMFWKSNSGYNADEAESLNKLAQTIISEE